MTLWFFDQNKRVYGPDSRSPIWREHWRPLTVVKETAKNYVLDAPIWYCGRSTIRVPKPLNRDFAWTQEDIDKVQRQNLAFRYASSIIASLSDDERMDLLCRNGLWPVTTEGE